MGLNQNPRIVTDGLVFYYDMGNTEKSFKGQPITNLVNPAWSAWSVDGSGSSGGSGTRTILSSYYVRISDVGQNTRQYIYISASANTTYTFSVKYKKIFGAPTLRFQLQAYNGGSFISTMAFPTTAQLGIVDSSDWQTAFFTVTTPANTTQVLWFVQDGDDYTNYTHTFELREPQMESGSIASSFVAGTRSNTQSVIDLTGNNTWTVNNLTYNSNRTFSFNGSSSWIESSTSSVFDSQNITLESWHKPTTLNQAGFLFEKGQVNTQYSNFYASDGTFYFRTIGLSPQDFTFAASTYIRAYQWNHVVCTVGGGTKTVYINGVQRYQQTSVTGTMPTGQTNQYVGKYGSGGNNYPFSGDIAISKVYNRVLSAAEVLQNYNALAERFFGYQTLTYTTTGGNLTITGNGTPEVSMFKTSGSGAWDNQVYSTEAFTAPCTIEFTKPAGVEDNSLSYAMIGWNTDPTTNASYTSIDHAAYPYAQNTYIVWNNGSAQSGLGTWDTAKRFYIVYDTDGYIRHYNGSKLLYTSSFYGTGNTVYVDSSFSSVSSTFGGFTNVKVCRRAWNGYTYV